MKIKVNGELITISAETLENYREKAFVSAEPYFNLIKNPLIRDLAINLWKKAPDYFFVIPASSSGKYHAEWSTGVGGLIRHVLTGVQAVSDLSTTFNLDEQECDIALAAIFGHDCLKYGIDYDERYHDMHPFLPRSYYGNKKSEAYLGDYVVPSTEFNLIMTAIERHMGSISNGSWTSVNGIKPETDIEKVVHLADYMASRKKFVMTDYVDDFQY